MLFIVIFSHSKLIENRSMNTMRFFSQHFYCVGKETFNLKFTVKVQQLQFHASTLVACLILSFCVFFCCVVHLFCLFVLLRSLEFKPLLSLTLPSNFIRKIEYTLRYVWVNTVIGPPYFTPPPVPFLGGFLSHVSWHVLSLGSKVCL